MTKITVEVGDDSSILVTRMVSDQAYAIAVRPLGDNSDFCKCLEYAVLKGLKPTDEELVKIAKKTP